MKWNAESYVENRIFDHRLVKDNLLDQWSPEGGQYPPRRDYRQFLENYPWHQSSLPPPLQPGQHSGLNSNVGFNYKTARAHPWRPTLAYEMCDTTPNDGYGNDIVAPTFVPQGMQTHPLTFPNLVSGYQNNPQHAAKAALYTRFTPGEWVNNNLSRFSESNVNRNLSERLRNEAVRAMRETDEKTAQAQRDAGRRLGERITDTTFWRNELNTELEKLIQEIGVLNECKRNVAKALQDLEAPLHIGQECLYHREGRREIEKVHDHVEKRILLEIDNLRSCQVKLRNLYEKCCVQIQECRSAQHSLEDDIAHKESTLGIDSVCHQLNNYSRGINYYSGIEKIDPTVSSMESWAMSSSSRINRSQTERTKSTQLRSEAETTINAVGTAVWDHWCNTNSSLERRSAEMAEAKSRIQLHLHKTIQEIFDLEKHISMLRKAIEDKSNPMKVAQTRLEARSHRDGIELCKDFAQMRLVQEVMEIQDSIQNLHRKLQDAENQHQQLLKTKAHLETDLKRKNNALHIDRENQEQILNMVIEKQTTLYSQLQPWSSSGAPPCVEPVSGPSVPVKVGISYQTTRPHPWRPTLSYEMLEANHLPEQPITNSFVNPCFMPTGMSTEPLAFPNLVTGFERNPQHAARAALYTRYTQGEWLANTANLFSESDSNRNNAERLRNECIRLMRESDEKCAGGQRESGRRLGERITDVTFWRNELNAELEKLVAETAAFSSIRQSIAKAIQDLETPLHIAQECLYHRESRKGQEKVHDEAEKALLIEIDNIRTQQTKLGSLYDKVSKQLSDCRAAQFALEEDVVQKESTLGIDSMCHQLNDYSRGINYYGGIEKYDPTVTTAETWSVASTYRINRSQQERSKTAQLRADVEQIINGIAASIWDYWANTNVALGRRAQEIENSKQKTLDHLQKVQQEIFELEKYISLILKAIQDKSTGLKVAQTRLEARTHREGIELCKDGAQLRLIQEVFDTNDSVKKLDTFLQESEAQLQELLKTRNNLESSLAAKINALFIDREKCLGMRRAFPVSTLIKY